MILSALVSVYNAERFLRGCLDDLLQQTIARDLEIIVIDAASPQREAEIVREYAHPNLVYLRAPRREPLYASWNRGIRAARGTYLTTANADDRHRRDGLERLVEVLERDRGAAFSYADVAVTLRENATFDDLRPFVFYRWPDFDRRRLFRAAFIGPQPVWRRALHERYGFFDESFVAAGDYEFWLRLAAAERFVHIAEPLGLYLASPGSIEHRHAELMWAESEAARERHWRAEWGARPRPGGLFLRADAGYVARELLHGRTAPLRELAQHARMIAGARISQNR
jgi:glycosyltransferase involved in cell wall biosynthesis